MFKSLLENQVQNAMKILGQTDGLAPNQTFVQSDLAGSSYDTVTRSYSTSEVDYPDVPMVLARFTTDEMDDEIVAKTDMKALIAALDLPVVPKIQDKIRTADGANYMVMRLMGVPGDSLYILHVRLTE